MLGYEYYSLLGSLFSELLPMNRLQIIELKLLQHESLLFHLAVEYMYLHYRDL